MCPRSLWEAVLSFHYMGSRNQIHVVRLGGEHLYSSHWPFFFFFKVFYTWYLHILFQCGEQGSVAVNIISPTFTQYRPTAMQAGSGLEKLEQKQLLPYRATVSSVTLDQFFNLSFSFFISTKGSYLLWVTAVRMIRIIFFNTYTRHSINYRLHI